MKTASAQAVRELLRARGVDLCTGDELSGGAGNAAGRAAGSVRNLGESTGLGAVGCLSSRDQHASGLKAEEARDMNGMAAAESAAQVTTGPAPETPCRLFSSVGPLISGMRPSGSVLRERSANNLTLPDGCVSDFSLSQTSGEAFRLTAGTHEWFYMTGEAGAQGDQGGGWLAPLVLFASLAAQVRSGLRPTVLWIGRNMWPTIALLQATQGVDCLEHQLLVDPETADQRVWAAEQALRCPGVAAVIADGSRLSLPATRKLLLAAEAGGALGLLARPPCERRGLSAATGRWTIQPSVSETFQPRWVVTALRCKGAGMMPGKQYRLDWEHEVAHATGVMRLSAVLGHRADGAKVGVA